DQELREIGTGAGPVERAHDGAGAVDRFQREDHVLDLSVLARELPGAARGEPAADGRAVDRRGKMPERRSLRVEQFLQPLAIQTGAGLDRARRQIDAQRTGEPLEIERDPAAYR